MHSKTTKHKNNSKLNFKSKKSDSTLVSDSVEVVSSTSSSSFGEVMARKRAGTFEKVNSWLNRGQDDPSQKSPLDGQGEPFSINSKYSPRCLDYPCIPNKVQSLLCYGEYSVFKKWLVLIEGDFVQIRFNATKKSELVKNNSHGTAEVTSLKVQKKKKCFLKEIRTLALTKNWLIICNMKRVYQIEKDVIVPYGVVLQLRRLVPLKYIDLRVSRPSQGVLSIANQGGLVKEYQLIENPSAVESPAFEKWQAVIKNLTPNHNDERLLLTIQMYERWTRQHSCRITLRPENQKVGSSSLFNRSNQKSTKRPAPPPPIRSESTNQTFPDPHQPSLLPKQTDPENPTLLRQFESDIPQVSGKNFQSSSKKGQSLLSEGHHSRSCLGKNGKKITRSICAEDEEEQDCELPRTPTMTESTFSDLVSGCEASVGPSDCLSNGQTSYLVSGIEASVGVSRPITPENEPHYVNESGSSNGDKKQKRSVKDLFKMGLFLSKKNKKKGSLAPSTGTPEDEPRPSPEPSHPRKMTRRTSRLEMGIPIEEVFSGIEFATLDKKPITFHKSDDSDLIEDPDELVAFEKQVPPHPLHEVDQDYLSYEAAYFESHDKNPNPKCVCEDLT